MEARNVGLLVAAVVVLGFAEGSAQGRGDGAFQPLLADPKQPQFFATYLWDRSPRLGSRPASVGFGQTISLVRESDWELAIAAGVFSEFNMHSATKHLINTHYPVVLPLAYRQWQVGWSLVTGLELADPAAAASSGWRWRVLLKAYTGPSPYGEFYRDPVSSLGLGIGFAL